MRRSSWMLGLGLVGCGVHDSAPDAPSQDLAIQPAATQTQCGSAFVDGIDVSDGNGAIDWTKVKAAGRDFAFIKATQGDYNHQKTFGSNWADAAAAGVQRSAYHFYDPTIDGSAQAQFFLDGLGSAGGMTAADLPPMVDIECPASSSESASKSSDPNCEYTGNSGWVATATLKQGIIDFVSVVTAATGRAPIVYSYPSWFGDVDDTDASLAALPLYIASYNACATVPLPWGSATFWQYSSTTTVPGISGTNDVDVDRFFGSAGDLATWNAGTLPDAGVVDAPDAGGNQEAPDAGTAHTPPAGCGCSSTTPSTPALGSFALFALVGGTVLRRRRALRRR